MGYIHTNPHDIDYPAHTDNCVTCAMPSRLDLPQPTGALTLTDEGIVGHSSDERYFIVAIDRQTAHGKQLFETWLNELSIGFKPLLGKFNGRVEYSHIINVRDWKLIRASGFISKQKYLLYLWPHAYGHAEYGIDARKATLYNLAFGVPNDNNTWEFDTKGYAHRDLGPFIAINLADVDNTYTEWSYDVGHDQYYAVKTT